MEKELMFDGFYEVVKNPEADVRDLRGAVIVVTQLLTPGETSRTAIAKARLITPSDSMQQGAELFVHDASHVKPILNGLRRQQIRAMLAFIGGDGHTIFKAEAVAKAMKCTDTQLDPFVGRYESDESDPKATITNGGMVVQACRGVYGLDAVEHIAGALQVRSGMMGRGFRCRDLTSSLHAVLDW